MVVPSGRQVRVHHVADGDQWSRTVGAHAREIVAVATVGPSRCVTASRDGILRVWDVDDSVCLRTIDIGEPIVDIACGACHSDQWDETVIVACRRRLYKRSLQRNSTRKSVMRLSDVGLTRIVCDESGNAIVAYEGQTLHLYRCERLHVGEGNTVGQASRENENPLYRHNHVRHDCKVTAVAVSADASLIAAGLENGVILVYRNLLENVLRYPIRDSSKIALRPAKLHWHAGPVLSLSFAAGNTLLLSGGTEAVLVSWKMTRDDFGEKSFRPRLGGAIWGISVRPDQNMYALTCADNCLRILSSANGTIKHAFHGLAVGHTSARNRHEIFSNTAKMSVVSRSGSNGQILVAGSCGSIQMFDVCRGEHIEFLQVVPRNLVHGVRSRSEDVASSRVKLMALSADGRHIAALDVLETSTPLACSDRKETSYHPEITETLRFWNQNLETGLFDLVGRSEAPHGRFDCVTAMEFHPNLPILVTSSSRGNVKLWKTLHSRGAQARIIWRCEVTTSRRGLPCSALSFSRDGSLLAATEANSIVLWRLLQAPNDVERFSEDAAALEHDGAVDDMSSVDLEYLRTLVHPPANEQVRSVSFVDGKFPVLVAITDRTLYVWNVMAHCIWWSLRLLIEPCPVSVDLSGEKFAIAVNLGGHTNVRDRHKSALSTSAGMADGIGSTSKGTTSVLNDAQAQDSRCKNAQEVTAKSCVPCQERTSGKEICLAIFDVNSPSPVTVYRIPHGEGLAASSFVSLGTSHTENLVFIDESLEVHVLSQACNEKERHSSSNVGSAAATNISVSVPASNRLDQLLGEEWRQRHGESENGLMKDGSASLQQATEQNRQESCSDVISVIQNAFPEQTHLAGPVSGTAYRTILSLLDLLPSADVNSSVDKSGNTIQMSAMSYSDHAIGNAANLGDPRNDGQTIDSDLNDDDENDTTDGENDDHRHIGRIRHFERMVKNLAC